MGTYNECNGFKSSDRLFLQEDGYAGKQGQLGSAEGGNGRPISVRALDFNPRNGNIIAGTNGFDVYEVSKSSQVSFAYLEDQRVQLFMCTCNYRITCRFNGGGYVETLM